jgi:hypothetical protein
MATAGERRTGLGVGLVLAAVGTLLLGVDGAGAAGPPPTNGPITLAPTSAEPGGAVTVSGGNCSGGFSIEVDFDGTEIAAQDHNGDTNWSVPITVPANATVGDHVVEAQCLISGATFDYDSATLTVTAPPASSTTTTTTAPPATQPLTFAPLQSNWLSQPPLAVGVGSTVNLGNLLLVVPRFVQTNSLSLLSQSFETCVVEMSGRVGPYGTISTGSGFGCGGLSAGRVRAAAAPEAQTTGGVPAGSFTTDANGVPTGAVKIPDRVPAGDYVLQLKASPSNVVYEIHLRVGAVDPLARTGADDHNGPLTAVAVALLLAGVGLVAESGLRRRRHAR